MNTNPQKYRAIVVPMIIVINIVVFVMWKTRDIDFMAENFLVSWNHLLDGRYWTLLTADFSHNTFWHIFINMFVLYSFGSFLEQVLGGTFFLSFYLVAGIVSTLSHALVERFVIGTPNVPAIGASGSIAGLVLLFAFMFPKQKILILGLIPVPALWGALGFMVFDLWGVFAQARGGGLPIGHAAHLGGAFSGIICYFLFVQKKRSYSEV